MTLIGTIPTELGELRALKTLDLSANSFNSAIPSEMGVLSNLQYLDFNHNSFNGSVPSSLCDLSNLQFLSFCSGSGLAGCLMLGPLPKCLQASLCIKRFGNLSYYDMPQPTLVPTIADTSRAVSDAIDAHALMLIYVITGVLIFMFAFTIWLFWGNIRVCLGDLRHDMLGIHDDQRSLSSAGRASASRGSRSRSSTEAVTSVTFSRV